MFRFYQVIKLLYYLIKIAKNPYATETVIKLGTHLRKINYLDHIIAKTAPHRGELNKTDILIGKIDLHKLKNDCPPGSFGRIYAEHMLTNNLDPEFYGKMKIKDEKDRYLLRIRQTHDFWHVLTGFSTSVEDELGLQAFQFSQIRNPISPILMGAALLRAGITNKGNGGILMERLTLGWQRGQEAKNLFFIDWESHWNTPLEEFRGKYNLRPITPSFILLQEPSKVSTDSAAAVPVQNP